MKLAGFPVSAGIDLSVTLSSNSLPGFPRKRGDRPQLADYYQEQEEVSP